MKKERYDEFVELSKPLNEWLQRNFSPHAQIVIKYDSAEVLEGEMSTPFDILG